MKIVIKTGYWEREPDSFKERTSNIMWFYGIGFMVNLANHILSDRLIMTIFNAVFFFASIMMITSYNKWRKEKWKKEQKEE